MNDFNKNDANRYRVLKGICDVIQAYCDSNGIGGERTDPYRVRLSEGGVVEVQVDSTGLFHWGHGSVTVVDDPELLEDCYADCMKVDPSKGRIYAPFLYCARTVGKRPDEGSYPHDRRYWPLFDACGPERGLDDKGPFLRGEVEAAIDFFGEPPSVQTATAGAAPG